MTNRKLFLGKGFHYKLSFTQHLKAHTGIRDKHCNFCGFKAISSNHLQRHVRARHTKEKNHICSYCNRAFSERYNMMSHVRKQHLQTKSNNGSQRTAKARKIKEKNHVCVYCDKAFSEGYMMSHLRKHHLQPMSEKNEASTFFKCTFCCMEYSDNLKLQQHLQTSHCIFDLMHEDFCII